MTYLAYQNLWQQKFRLALTVMRMALATGLIILLNGFEAGVYRQVQEEGELDENPTYVQAAQHSKGVTRA